jgi:hypothetical protein
MKTQLYADILLEAAERIDDCSNVYCCPAITSACRRDAGGSLCRLLLLTFGSRDSSPGHVLWSLGYRDKEARILALLLLREQVLNGDHVSKF